jgi:hypothetical protein
MPHNSHKSDIEETQKPLRVRVSDEDWDFGTLPRKEFCLKHRITGSTRNFAMLSARRIFFTAFLVMLAVALAASPHYTRGIPSPQPEPHANCCLCMCRAKDETKCHPGCIARQHSRRIIGEREMNLCTRQCNKYRVEKTETLNRVEPAIAFSSVV